MKKGILISAAVIIAGGAGVFALTAFAGKPKEYFAQKAAYESIAEEIDVTGDVKGEKSTTYYSVVTAPISEYTAKVGDSVIGDQVVLLYDTEDLQNALDQAVLTAESSENTMNGQIAESDKKAALYNQAVNDSNIYMNLYAMARYSNDSIDQSHYTDSYNNQLTRDNISKCIAEKNQTILGKSQELEDRRKDLLRLTPDTPDYVAVSTRIDELNSEINGLNMDISSLNVQLASLPSTSLTPDEKAVTVVNGNWMSDINRNWTQSTTVKNTYESQILNSYQKDQLKNTYDLSELSVMIAQDNIAKASQGVAVDYNGIITESFVNSGSVVSKGSPLFTIESSDELKVVVGISKYDIGKLSVGQRALITIAGHEYEGSISEIKKFAKMSDSDKAKVDVSVHIDNPDEYVYLGLEADVTIYANEKEGAIVIPLIGCYADDDGDYCYLIRNDVIEKQYITTGVESEDYVEVTDGIRVGDVVITDAVTDKAIGGKAVAK